MISERSCDTDNWSDTENSAAHQGINDIYIYIFDQINPKIQELNPEKSPLSQLVLRLTNLTNSTNTNQSQTSTASHLNIKINQIIKQSKNTYLEHWDQETKTQSKLQLYRTINQIMNWKIISRVSETQSRDGSWPSTGSVSTD